MNDPLFSVQDQVVLVSGGSRGIGRELAAAMAQRGARVVISGRDATTLQQTASEISTPQSKVNFLVCDVAIADQVPSLVQSVVSQLGRIDILLNVAGINVRKRVEEYSVEEYDLSLIHI